MPQTPAILTYVGSDGQKRWVRGQITMSGAGAGTVLLGQNNGTRILAILAGTSTGAAPVIDVGSVQFGYDGGNLLPDASFPSEIPVPITVPSEPIPVGIDIDPSRALRLNASLFDAALVVNFWVLFEKPDVCK